MEKVISKIEFIHKSISILFLLTFVFSVILQVLSRYLPFVSVYWTEELAVYSFIWSVFLGASILVLHNEHFTMTFLLEKLSKPLVKWVNIFNQILVFIFGLLMLYYGILLVQGVWGWGFNTITIVNQEVATSAVPVSGFMIMLYALYNILVLLKNKNNQHFI